MGRNRQKDTILISCINYTNKSHSLNTEYLILRSKKEILLFLQTQQLLHRAAQLVHALN